MDRCQLCEIEISALLDGESPEESLLPVLDHLVACAACRDFYQRARRLADALGHAPTPLATSPPPELWRTIERQSGLAPASMPRRRSARWSQIAAVVLLALGAWAVARAPERAGERTQRLEVVLGEDAGTMTEARFAQIVVDVLRADRRYHREMLEVMTAVAALSGDHRSREPLHQSLAHQELEAPRNRELGSPERGHRTF